jgi:hypothetical protein
MVKIHGAPSLVAQVGIKKKNAADWKLTAQWPHSARQWGVPKDGR